MSGVLGPEHAETLAIWYQLAHWTALAGDAAATRTSRHTAGPPHRPHPRDDGDGDRATSSARAT